MCFMCVHVMCVFYVCIFMCTYVFTHTHTHPCAHMHPPFPQPDQHNHPLKPHPQTTDPALPRRRARPARGPSGGDAPVPGGGPRGPGLPAPLRQRGAGVPERKCVSTRACVCAWFLSDLICTYTDRSPTLIPMQTGPRLPPSRTPPRPGLGPRPGLRRFALGHGAAPRPAGGDGQGGGGAGAGVGAGGWV